MCKNTMFENTMLQPELTPLPGAKATVLPLQVPHPDFTRAFHNVMVICIVGVLITFTQMPIRAQLSPSQPVGEEASGYTMGGAWGANGIGHGFRPNSHEFGFDLSGGYGPPILGQRHDYSLVLSSVHYGWIFAPRWELLGELWGGQQLNKGYGSVVGVTPHVRYFFMNHTRWVPFLDIGCGLTETSIRNGDLSTDFEFNLQFGVGVQYFLRPNTALSFEYRYLHLSNAGMQLPNDGVNVELFSAGLSWRY